MLHIQKQGKIWTTFRKFKPPYLLTKKKKTRKASGEYCQLCVTELRMFSPTKIFP